MNDRDWHNFLTAIVQQLNRIERKLDLMRIQEAKMADDLDEITADVAAETTVEGSIMTLLTSIAAKLAAAGQDPTKLAALHSAIQTNIAAMTAAVTANTPAATP